MWRCVGARGRWGRWGTAHHAAQLVAATSFRLARGLPGPVGPPLVVFRAPTRVLCVFVPQARAAMLSGVNKLADAVQVWQFARRLGAPA